MGLLANEGDDKKPLFRQYIKQCKKAGEKEHEIYDVVIEIRLSSSEEWILIEGEKSVALVNAESKVGKEFWTAIQHFKGTLKALMLIPAKGKLGFDIEPMDDVVTHWEWDGEGKLIAGEESASLPTLTQKLSLENMQPSRNVAIVEALTKMQSIMPGTETQQNIGTTTPPPKSVSKKEQARLHELTKYTSNPQ